MVVLKWLLIGRARPGRYPVHGWFYVRNWVVEQLLAFSVDIAGPLHATLFLKPWYRALGARLGRFVEISTASVTTPDLLAIGDDCTIADEVSLGAARVERGWLTLAPTKLGRRVFVGNSAVIPAGTLPGRRNACRCLDDRSRRIPARPGASAPAGWARLPSSCRAVSQAPLFPEQRLSAQREAPMDARLFRNPPRHSARRRFRSRHGRRPVDAALKLWAQSGPLTTLFLLPAIFAACCAAVILAVAAAKWIVVGRYRPFRNHSGARIVWRLELVNALFEFLATPIGLEALRGTPLLPWYLRLLGAQIGRRVYIDSTGFLEFDLMEVGDRCDIEQRLHSADASF